MLLYGRFLDLDDAKPVGRVIRHLKVKELLNGSIVRRVKANEMTPELTIVAATLNLVPDGGIHFVHNLLVVL